ncbi:MAG: LLM class flavin-dependent oxidoreductase [Nitrososphaeria archaeon]|nr:LLM class flavin-dependent oxidoreductase [Nitrososphaeria archaeon]NIN51851.1 LLM class flavin-dependent oxidoreductase [Nitrososphaeria archaeon]NIQ32373.1 LLM class flavin-dependent oxidoreductase [Nitrososphaeria archaeon]
MTDIKFGSYLFFGPIEQIIQQGLLAERYGFDSVWFPDHHISVIPTTECPENWTVLTAIGMRTKRIVLGPAVTDPLRRHPSTTAQTVATLDRLLGGRVALGIGAGERMNLIPFGIPWTSPIERLREAVKCIKMLWSATTEEPASYEGKFFHLKDAFLGIKPRQDPPIYIGALGPRTRELVGELAEGWFPWIITPELFKESLKDIEKGAKKVGRNLREIDAAVVAYTAITEDYEEAIRMIEPRGKMALILERRVLERIYRRISLTDEITIQKTIPTNKSLRILREAVEEIPIEAVEAISICGTVDHCIKKIEKYIEAGSKHIIISNQDPNIENTLRQYGEKIIPYFKAEYGEGV